MISETNGEAKTKTNESLIDTLLECKPANEAQSNDRIQLVLQGLYKSLLESGAIQTADLMESNPTPKTVADQRDLIVKKIQSIHQAMISNQ